VIVDEELEELEELEGLEGVEELEVEEPGVDAPPPPPPPPPQPYRLSARQATSTKPNDRGFIPNSPQPRMKVANLALAQCRCK